MTTPLELCERALEELGGIAFVDPGSSLVDTQIARATKALRELREVLSGQGWRPIAEAPKDGTEVLLLIPPKGFAVVGVWKPGRTSAGRWLLAWNHEMLPPPSAWLPASPVREEKP